MRILWTLLVVASVLLWPISQAMADAAPKVLSVPFENLVENKTKYLQNDEAVKPAIDKLLREAVNILDEPAKSVMDKESVADSGNKRDYYSVAPYWWPNPDTPDGLPYINRDGVWNSEERAKTDSDAMGQTCNRVQVLGLAYFFSGDERYAEKATELVRVGFLNEDTGMNPHLEYAQAIKGRHSGSSVGVLEGGEGFTKLLDGVSLIENSAAWTKGDAAALRKWFEAYNKWLHESEIGRGAARFINNLGTWYYLQVVYLYLYLDENQKARETAENGFKRLLDLQFAADGSQPAELRRTKSFAYHAYNLQAWGQLATVAKTAGFDGWNYQTENGRSLRQGLAFLAPYADPDKAWIKEDIQPKNPQSLMPLFALAAQHSHDPQVFEAALKHYKKSRADRWVIWSRF